MQSNTRKFRTVAASLALIATVALSGCSNGGDGSTGDAAASISVSKVKGVGRVLVDGKGDTLYVFKPDNAMTVSCTQACATKWPPLEASGKNPPRADGDTREELLGTLPSPDGKDVVTYNGWPLYRYESDQTPGDARGQNIYLNGGDWYVIGADGKPIVPSSTS